MFTSPAYPFPENSSTLGGYSSSISFSLERTVFSNSPGHYFFLSLKGGDDWREGNYWREAIISNIAHWKSFSKYFVLFAH